MILDNPNRPKWHGSIIRYFVEVYKNAKAMLMEKEKSAISKH
jgi:hypothetical protein